MEANWKSMAPPISPACPPRTSEKTIAMPTTAVPMLA
jgi:hypothetical protein